MYRRGAYGSHRGTDNHLLQIDVTPFNLTGRQAETLLRDAGITLNKNTIPFDPNGPWYTSGLRVGTPALTTLGMGFRRDAGDRRGHGQCAHPCTAIEVHKGQKRGTIQQVQYRIQDGVLEYAQQRIAHLLARFPVYPELDLAYLQEAFGSADGRRWTQIKGE